MPIFKMEKNKLALIAEKKIKLEKDIQKLTEENLSIIRVFDIRSYFRCDIIY